MAGAAGSRCSPRRWPRCPPRTAAGCARSARCWTGWPPRSGPAPSPAAPGRLGGERRRRWLGPDLARCGGVAAGAADQVALAVPEEAHPLLGAGRAEYTVVVGVDQVGLG